MTGHAVIVSLLKAWNMTVVEIECEGATLFQEGPHKKWLFQVKIFFFNFYEQNGKVDYQIIVDIVNYLYLPYVITGKL